MKLAAHGSYKIEPQDNILLVDAHGPFNEVTAQAYVQEMYQACDNFAGRTWGILVTFYGNSIFTPDAEQALIDVTRYRMNKGMIANASVILNSNSADIQQMQLRRIYQTCNLPFHVFSDIDSAKNWLISYIEDNEVVIS
ncbi:hypothetical protein tinsulaeT_23550 [Thalassotalea insulae]|uniref:STAS/SEC14 domain-containing protein n=1 Tax=Thalassotalea insulae TaxID=2056778 RepID=A0ABQ6GWX2_9GAMM|nr:hypothetical protein [Thalassotalea insulae]GLX79015.1 hypothetical protein tinsulaeT_23550 [Thalassotalea insulae]